MFIVYYKIGLSACQWVEIRLNSFICLEGDILTSVLTCLKKLLTKGNNCIIILSN